MQVKTGNQRDTLYREARVRHWQWKFGFQFPFVQKLSDRVVNGCLMQAQSLSDHSGLQPSEARRMALIRSWGRFRLRAK